ncbi:HNH endonuclease signature motif containing protein [Mesorhizobium sp.]|uniref:HNH endonuclease signature motif containing protein n=1 Tax=Mesorhizobium sp. TaxID=1871066 RepID=UPI001227E7C9|nr:HNH endonuclease signature motif containing protein [Mesorhizobium sp.]TIN80713.1 MAG: HNH endonuclease [Mesorhizobium sp.]
MARNKHGLARKIPTDVEQLVRKACGFGCVICGSIPYEYDHLQVEFKDAKVHDPEDIVLLCDTHHKMKGNKLLSVEAIKRALKSRAGENSESRFKLPATSRDFEVNWAGNIIMASDNSVVVDGVPILSFVRTDNEMEPVLISGQFRDRFGKVVCDISDNAFTSYAERLGDFTLIKNRFSYTLPGGPMGLAFELNDRGMRITYAYHVKNDVHVFAEGDLLQVGNLFTTLRLRKNKFLQMQQGIIVGSCSDNFAYDGVDLSKFPANEMIGNSVSRGYAGVLIEGRPRYRISSNYDRL